MSQVPKEHIRNLILETALNLFALNGYNNTSIADIAKHAGISVGNIYRYFESKFQIFNIILPEEFVLNFKEQLLKKIITGSIGSIKEQSNNLLYITYSEAFHHYVISNRLKLLILISNPEETPYNTFKEDIIDYWVQIVLEHFVFDKECREKVSLTLTILFQGYLQLYRMVLSMELDEARIIDELKRMNKYHIMGLSAILEELNSN